MSGAPKTFSRMLRDVLEALQQAEELGGPEGHEYVELLEAVIDEARRRIETVRANGRD